MTYPNSDPAQFNDFPSQTVLDLGLSGTEPIHTFTLRMMLAMAIV